MKRLLAVAAVVIGLEACGPQPTTGGSARETPSPVAASPRASPAPSLTPSAKPSPLPTPAVPAGWKAYTSLQWGYAIAYPASWYNLPNLGAPDTDKYFSNEIVGAPLGMSSNGLWAMVRITSSTCPGPTWAAMKPAGSYAVSMGDQHGTAYSVDPDLSIPGGRDLWYGVSMGVPRSGGCTFLVVETLNQATRDASIPLALQWMGTLRQGAP